MSELKKLRNFCELIGRGKLSGIKYVKLNPLKLKRSKRKLKFLTKQLFTVAVFHCIVLYCHRYRQGQVLTVVVLLAFEFHGFHVFGKPIFPQR